ncbi:GntR family transcriptional regulator [Clostridium senegalense]|uniref:GntR family transcriptional regulator n=1 Tax=Clostridium senegalense TaxID=1465809 RepID=A0A6M0H953_9CLOT|nr:GntR family transcriptional regulator [Clostridium senegalense]NEU06401.1 GntR family transcriptional regulator [Clostridium senegalense]
MNIVIDNSSGKPIYSQIEEQIKKSIFEDKLILDDILPSIRALSQELKISVITTKRAYEELEKQGFVYTVPGKGTFISDKDKEFIKYTIMDNVKKYLLKGINEGKKINLSLDNMKEKLEIIYKY